MDRIHNWGQNGKIWPKIGPTRALTHPKSFSFFLKKKKPPWLYDTSFWAIRSPYPHLIWHVVWLLMETLPRQNDSSLAVVFFTHQPRGVDSVPHNPTYRNLAIQVTVLGNLGGLLLISSFPRDPRHWIKQKNVHKSFEV